VPSHVLACSVRNCGLPLERQASALLCAAGHSFDIARAGYINLLQPQDRRSAHAGDSNAAIDARARLLDAGVGRASLIALIDRARALTLGDQPAVVDLGCGSGELLGELAARLPITGVGIDLSAHAVTRAARAFPELTWVVANADRRLPILDDSVDLVVSLHGRRNADECARVLAPGRFVLIGIPAVDDLAELRSAVQGPPPDQDRTEALVAEFGNPFELVDRRMVWERRALDRTALEELLTGTYRGARKSARDRISALTTLDVTLSTELLLFHRH
jgi:23S rRNA (guanine745-N1)-methyltransferase